MSSGLCVILLYIIFAEDSFNLQFFTHALSKFCKCWKPIQKLFAISSTSRGIIKPRWTLEHNSGWMFAPHYLLILWNNCYFYLMLYRFFFFNPLIGSSPFAIGSFRFVFSRIRNARSNIDVNFALARQCCLDSNRCDDFIIQRPPNYCRFYRPPRRSKSSLLVSLSFCDLRKRLQ